MWKIKIVLYMEIEFFSILCERVEEEVIEVFVKNLNDLLMVVLVGVKIIMGLDSGLCIGVKVVVVDKIGKVLVINMIFFYVL